MNLTIIQLEINTFIHLFPIVIYLSSQQGVHSWRILGQKSVVEVLTSFMVRHHTIKCILSALMSKYYFTFAYKMYFFACMKMNNLVYLMSDFIL